jgi:nitrite reductase/ring-hydroxylating ferredoxin subunit
MTSSPQSYRHRWISLGPSAALGEGRSIVASHDASASWLLLRRDGQVHAWLDRCPHTGMSLRWDPRPFATADGRYLECAAHSALFRVGDGMCVRGPCVGEALTRGEVEERDGVIWLQAASP